MTLTRKVNDFVSYVLGSDCLVCVNFTLWSIRLITGRSLMLMESCLATYR